MRRTYYVIDAMKKLSDDDERIVTQTVIWLGYTRNSKPRDILINLLNHSSADVRRWTVRTLAKIGDEDTLDSLVNCQNDSDEMVRKTVEWAMKHFPASDTPSIDCSLDDLDLLVQTLESGTDDQKILAIIAMGVLDWPHNTLAFPHLLKALEEPNPQVREETLFALYERSIITDCKSYFFAIRDCLVDDDASVRDAAGYLMASFLGCEGEWQPNRGDYDGIIKPEILQNDEKVISVGLAFYESRGDLELIRKAMMMLHEIVMTNVEQS
jgi:HEAT repeat protein